MMFRPRWQRHPLAEASPQSERCSRAGRQAGHRGRGPVRGILKGKPVRAWADTPRNLPILLRLWRSQQSGVRKPSCPPRPGGSAAVPEGSISVPAQRAEPLRPRAARATLGPVGTLLAHGVAFGSVNFPFYPFSPTARALNQDHRRPCPRRH
jgi:hypothetical protein